jgi:hypothetical protein
MPVLNSVGFDLAKDKLVTSADGEKTLKVVAVGYGRTGTVRSERSKFSSSGSLIAMASLFSFESASSKIKISAFARNVCCPLRVHLRFSTMNRMFEYPCAIFMVQPARQSVLQDLFTHLALTRGTHSLTFLLLLFRPWLSFSVCASQYSLTLALEELGFPTLHTQHLYEHDEIISMWTNEIFLPSIREEKTSMGRPNLQLIADYGYQATADMPMALYYEQVMEEFPDCKFVLTTRENSEIWFRSWDTLTSSITEPTNLGGVFFTGVRQYSQYLRWLYSVVNKDESYLTVPFPLPPQNKQASIASYEEHNRRVRATIPSDKLLEYSVKDGWNPLCNFLEINNCPDTPFPRTNTARSVQVQAATALIAPLVCVLFVLFYGFVKLFRQLTGMTIVQWSQYKSRELTKTLQRVVLGVETSEWKASPKKSTRKMS